MSDEYEFAAKGKLKLKNDSQHKKKKKSKHKHKDKEREKVYLQTSINESLEDKVSSGAAPKLTKAELAFKQQQEKMVSENVEHERKTLLYSLNRYNNYSATSALWKKLQQHTRSA